MTGIMRLRQNPLNFPLRVFTRPVIFYAEMALSLLFLGSFVSTLRSQVITYPAPAGADLSSDYSVKVNDAGVPVYLQNGIHGGAYSYAYFDFSGSVTIEIASETKDLGRVIMRPAWPGVTQTMKGDTLVVLMDAPHKVSIEPDGINSPLLIFGDPIQQNPPQQGDPGVLYFGPGLYNTNVTVGTNQTLYIAGGAVINGSITMTGNHSRVTGRGIVSGKSGGGNLHAQNARNVSIEGVIFAGSPDWTVVPSGCDSVAITNIKILNSWKPNEDGIDVVNCRDVWIRDVFIRTDDDCIAIKGLDRSKTCERITVEQCIFWADRADVFRIGWESEASGIMAYGTVVRDCEVLHAVEVYHSFDYWSYCPFGLEPSENTPMENLRFEDIRINVDPQPQFTLARLCPIIRTGWGWNGTENGKTIRNVVFRNIILTGVRQQVTVIVKGVDAQHDVDGVVFENIQQFGQCTQENTPGVVIGGYAAHVTFTHSAGNSRVTGIAVNPASAVLMINGALQLSPTVSPIDASNQAVSWSSSDPAVTAVSANGLIIAKTAGSAVITATTQDGGKSAGCDITVVPFWLPAPWAFNDIGSPALLGNVSHVKGRFTLTGSGLDIWDSSDQFAYVSCDQIGNGAVSLRVVSQTRSNDWAKAGVMFRESIDAGSKFIMLVVTPWNGLNLQWRDATGGNCGFTVLGSCSLSTYLRLERKYNVFNAYTSADGVTWGTPVGSHAISFVNRYKAGMCVTSHDAGCYSTAVFDNVTVDGNTRVQDAGSNPVSFWLSQNYPNPFNPSTRFEYSTVAFGKVIITVFDVTGRLVRTLVDAERAAGNYSTVWDGRSGDERTVETGVYFVRMEAEGLAASRKILYLK
jgi:hypothetical protein